jgi:2-polyprenyl-3-methyl-5-hydroxy-6-metoxy-1,4-benzoquinol methylase
VATRVLQLERCPVCGGERFADEHVGGDVHLRRCEVCDTVSAREYAEPDEVYVEGYLKGGTDFGIDLTNPRFLEYLRGIAGRRVDFVEKATGMRPGRMLDVGCGTGQVLVAARDRGWDVRGVEPLADASNEARERHGLDVQTATLEKAELPDGTFDVVCGFHVLEHMPDTRAFLVEMARHLRPRGCLVLEVPNYDSAIRRHHGVNWSALRPLEHLVHFTADSLGNAVFMAGLEPVRVTTASWVGPPQSLDQALADLAKYRWEPLLAPLCPRREVDGAEVRVPSAVGWAALKAMERLSVARRHGQVALAVARRL